MSDTTDPGSQSAAPDAAASPDTGANTEHQTGHGAPEQNAGDQQTGTAPENAGNHDDEPEGVKKRIGEVTRARREAEREAAYWRGVAEARQQQPQPQQDAGKAPALPPQLMAQIGPEPQPNDFPAGEFDPAYLRQVAAYDRKVETYQAQFRQHQQQQATAQAERTRTLAAKVESASGRIGDFRNIVTTLSTQLPNAHADLVADLITDSDAGPDVAAFLARNPAERDALARLSPRQAAIQLGRLEARVSADLAAAARQQSAAPPPPATVRGGGSAAVQRDPNKMSTDEYVAYYNRSVKGGRS